ncbi:MAG: B12-binding domain-containing radical SAM protein, partial [Anaerolineae bacterium]|nr:B12-binding domain-containing radical SAM protein [Anaerolineae bacterium]
MRILMIYPQIPETFWGFQHALAFIRKNAAFPPMGLLTVASLLPAEWEKRLIDINVVPLTQSDLEWADFVFVSAMVVQREAVRDVFRRCKKVGLPIVAGGPLFMHESQCFSEVDHFVLGEAEVVLPGFVDDVRRDRLKRVYVADGFADMTHSPMPAWELVDLRRYWAMAVQYSRGCPYDCDFCDVTRMLGHTVRTKTVDQVIGELDRLYALGWRAGVLFADDNFIGGKRKLKAEILPALVDWRRGKKGIVLWTQACLNLADDPELLDLMVRAGFEQV